MKNECNDESDKCIIQGLDLVLKSINCDKYVSNFKDYGINEYTILHLTASDLRFMDVDENDITPIMNALNVLNKTSDLINLQLSHRAVSQIQSNVCGHLGTIALTLNFIHHVITSKTFEDSLIDNHLSSINGALMLKPYMRAEEEEMGKILKKGLKTQNKIKIVLIASTACAVCLYGLALRHWNYSFNCNPTSNLISKIQIWKN